MDYSDLSDYCCRWGVNLFVHSKQVRRIGNYYAYEVWTEHRNYFNDEIIEYGYFFGFVAGIIFVIYKVMRHLRNKK